MERKKNEKATTHREPAGKYTMKSYSVSYDLSSAKKRPIFRLLSYLH